MEITEKQFLEAIKLIEKYRNQIQERVDKLKHTLPNSIKKETLIKECGISTLTLNCLKSVGVNKIADLESFKLSEIKRVRGIGFRGFLEIQDLLFKTGITLKN